MAQDKDGQRHAGVSVSVLILALWMPGCSQGPTAPAADQPARLTSRSFFGIPLGDKACKVIYISDISGSMTDSIDYVKIEMKRSIANLTEADEFDVLFMSSGPPREMPGRRVVKATERNKQLAFEFIDGIIAQGETDPVESVKRAFSLQPEIIFILTDGEFDKFVVDLVKGLNAGGKVKVHTVAFLYETAGKALKEIAEQNGGVYKFVSEADLARLSP